jgi:hypothetical protein
VLPCDTLSQRNLIGLIALALTACSSSSPDGPGVVYDPCNAAVRVQGNAAQEAAVGAALALWNAAAGLDLALDATAAPTKKRIPAVFEDTAVFHGFYDDQHGVVYLNERLGASTQTIVAAHELGHSFGLVHVERSERPSLMNPGNLDIGPSAEDAAALLPLWGKCASRATERAFPR